MNSASLLNPEDPTFDRVEVIEEGKAQTFSRTAFLALPLSLRIRLILAGQPRFLLGESVVEMRRALALRT